MALLLIMGRMADGWEGCCILSAVPRLGQWLGATIFITGFVVACCIFLVVGFVVVVLVAAVMSTVVIGTVVGVADCVCIVIVVMVGLWVVGVMILVMGSFEVGVDIVAFVNDGNGTVAVIVCGIGRWCIFSVNDNGKKGSRRKLKGQFIV